MVGGRIAAALWVASSILLTMENPYYNFVCFTVRAVVIFVNVINVTES